MTGDLGPISAFLLSMPWPVRVQPAWCGHCRTTHIVVFVRCPDGLHFVPVEPFPLDFARPGR